MSFTEAHLWDRLHQARHQPYGAGQIALVEQAEAAIQQALTVLPDGADRQPYLEVLEIARQTKSRLDQAEEAR